MEGLDIYIIKTSTSDQAVITRWGFLADTPGAEKGIINKFVNAIRVPMIFDVRYIENEKPAADEQFIFEFEEKKEIATSDDQGKIILESVKVDSFVKAYQV